MNKKIIIGFIVGFVFIGLLIFILHKTQKPITQSTKLQVVTSFYPLYFFTSEIVGDKVTVSNITPSGAEPHEYEPTARDMATIENSDLLVLNGVGLESWGKNIRTNINSDKTKIVITGEDLATMVLVKEGQRVVDPHIWLSPILAEQMVDSIELGLSQVDPNNTLYYQSNSQKLKEKLSVLDEEFKQGLATCGEKNIITSHLAFAYLAREYNLNQVSITGLSPDAEPSPQQLADIVKFAKANNVNYIFFESLVSPKLANTVATELGVKTLVLNPIEGLSNEEISKGNNYFTEMENNLINLKIALQCK